MWHIKYQEKKITALKLKYLNTAVYFLQTKQDSIKKYEKIQGTKD